MNTSSMKEADQRVIAEWPKGPNEVVRVSLQKFRGHTILSIRVWYQNSDETVRPGRNGISLSLAKHSTRIRKALRKAEKTAVARGEQP